VARKASRDSRTGRLFADAQGDFFEKSGEEAASVKPGSPVECLGMEFQDDEHRREYFIELLREKLKDGEFRSLPGFPLAEDEDILRLSDPPYYTACPNPFIQRLIEHHSASVEAEDYVRTPYTQDVAATKADAVYTAHSYHTKVPPKAIATFISHYTRPGDVILDLFSGSGMTGVAARMVDREEAAMAGEASSLPRFPICIDLSPAATFIASVYQSPPDPESFQKLATSMLSSVSSEYRSTYRSGLESLSEAEEVDYILWAECFVCPSCQGDVLSADVVRPTGDTGAASAFECPSCGTLVSKAPTKASGASRLERRLEVQADIGLGGTRMCMRRVPLAVQVRGLSESGKPIRQPLSELSAERRACQLGEAPSVQAWFPTDALLQGERYAQKDCLEAYGITHVHHFYLPRQLAVYSRLWELASQHGSWSDRQGQLFFVESNGLGLTVMNRYQPSQFGKATGGSQVNRYFSGTLYVPSTVTEVTADYAYTNKLKRLTKAFRELAELKAAPRAISTQSGTDLSNISDASVDYVFVDPPFGRNLQYSELNQIWEAWLRVKTNREPEAVIDSTRERDVGEYAGLMRDAFREAYRVLKPGRWLTVEFHNSSNAVWHGIQEALMSAGFVVADVRALNKMQETYKQSRQGLMKQDLVISAYRPTRATDSAGATASGGEETVWKFTREHLGALPVAVERDGKVDPLSERQGRVLFDRMVAFFVQRGIPVPLSKGEYCAGLDERFPCRDQMYFLESQVSAYERMRAKVGEVGQIELFIFDEASSIEWLREALRKKPQGIKELQPAFMRESGASWAKYETAVELEEILEQNFLRYDGKGPVPAQIHSYLSTNFKELRKLEKSDQALIGKAKDRWYVPDPAKQVDLELVREKRLLREFEQYREAGKKKRKKFRTEAIRAGFKAAYESQDYGSIVAVASLIPEEVLQEDDMLLMYVDVASTRLGG